MKHVLKVVALTLLLSSVAYGQTEEVTQKESINLPASAEPVNSPTLPPVKVAVAPTVKIICPEDSEVGVGVTLLAQTTGDVEFITWKVSKLEPDTLRSIPAGGRVFLSNNNKQMDYVNRSALYRFRCIVSGPTGNNDDECEHEIYAENAQPQQPATTKKVDEPSQQKTIVSTQEPSVVDGPEDPEFTKMIVGWVSSVPSASRVTDSHIIGSSIRILINRLTKFSTQDQDPYSEFVRQVNSALGPNIQFWQEFLTEVKTATSNTNTKEETFKFYSQLAHVLNRIQ